MGTREDDLLDQRHQEVITAISGVHERLDLLNGRTRTLENKVNVLSWAYGLMSAGWVYLWHRVTGQQ